MRLVTEFGAAAVGHGLLGIVLAGTVWSLGLGLLARLRRGRAVSGDLMLAFPIGTLVIFALAFGVLVFPLAAAAMLPIAGLAGAGMRRLDRAAIEDARAAVRAAVAASPYTLGFAVALGLYYHGPTDNFDSHAFGDVVWYAAKFVSAQDSIVPFRDLAALDSNFPLVQSGPTAVLAAISTVVPLDPFLAHASLLPAFLVASVHIGIGAVSRTYSARSGVGRLPSLGAALVATGIVAYPTWIVESPPVAFAAPLAFAAYRLARFPVQISELLVHAGVIGLCIVFSKLLAAVALLPVFAYIIVRDHRAALRRHLLAFAAALLVPLVGAAILVLATSAWSLGWVGVEFAPLGAIESAVHQLEGRSTQGFAPVLGIIGVVALVVWLRRRRQGALLAALVASIVATWVVSGHSLDVAVGIAVLLAAAAIIANPPSAGADPSLVLLAGVGITTSSWFRDTAQLPASFVFTLLLAAGVLAAAWVRGPRLVGRAAGLATVGLSIGTLGLAGKPLLAAALATSVAACWIASAHLPLPASLKLSPLTAVVLVVVVFAGATSAGAAGTSKFGYGTYDSSVYPREWGDVWARVADTTPAGALIFTSLTSEDDDVEGGWNYSPALGRRQVYLSGWLYASFSRDASELRRRLGINRAVLSGRTPPDAVAGAGDFESFYAVLWKMEARPLRWREVYSNRLYALYRVPAGRSGGPLVTDYSCPDYKSCVRLARTRVVSAAPTS